ncbi:MAG: MarR family winged helix-turn-helix transcriptional regulator [Mycobacteriaceae bacterium]
MPAVDPLALANELRPLLFRINLALRQQTLGVELTPTQASVMLTLRDHGPIRMGELAEREFVQLPTATSVISRLEKLGLVNRQPDTTDRRAVVVDLTASGSEAIIQTIAKRNDLLCSLLTGLSEEDRAKLSQAISPLTRLLEQDNLARLRNEITQ